MIDGSSELRGQRIATLISGGLDSATLVAWAATSGIDQAAFFVAYGQDNYDYEYACARINCQQWNVPLEIVHLESLRNSFVGRFPFPLNLYDCLVKNPLGQITTFALTALVAGIGVLAERYTLMLGIHHTDMELRPVLNETMTGLEKAVNCVVSSFTDDKQFQLLLPFKDYDRSKVIETGLALGVDYVNTWSCHENTDTPCGSCEGCQERAEAFTIARTSDPQVGRTITVPVHANKISARI